MKKIIIPAILFLVFAPLGLYFGSIYGGNNGCFEFLGLRGYESCGVYFALIGGLIGLLLGLLIVKIKFD